MDKFSIQQGFTLLEMLLVFTIVGVLTGTSIASFFSYSRNQTFTTTASNIEHYLNTARSRALSQVKPAVCGTSSLEGYQFWHPTLGAYYRLSVRCGGVYHVLERRNLPKNITFATGSTTVTFFNVRTGTSNAATNILLTGYGRTRTITVAQTGVISVQEP